MLAWLSILAFKASGSRKENLGDKLAKFAPGCLSSPTSAACHVPFKCMEPVVFGRHSGDARPAHVK